MLNLNSIMIGTSQVDVMAAFYKKVFQKDADMHEGNWYGWSVGNCFISIGEHSEVQSTAKDPQRLILNFETTEVKEEFDRIKELGAIVVKEPYQMETAWIATLSDPDGNYFQLMTPWDNK